ncbi:hypothetical protein [Massilia sp. BSC265]|uniref:hypothetical protein n=1 Tax=Massilia sp. BSC265 TaxID=1549812 RepID=UPI000AC010C7|nr:hypothetical protein [Massilia sp. BSC265]
MSEAAEVEHLAPLPGRGISLVGGELAQAEVEGDSVWIATTGPAGQVQGVHLGLHEHHGKRSEETIPHADPQVAVPPADCARRVRAITQQGIAMP